MQEINDMSGESEADLTGVESNRRRPKPPIMRLTGAS